MADRVINVNIKYNVDTSQVSKATDQSQRAQKATDDLRKSAAAAGQGISQGFKNAGTSIEAMKIQLERLKTQISLLNRGDSRLKGLSDQYKRLSNDIKKANDEAFKTPKALNETKGAAQGAASSFGQFATAVRTFIAAGVVREVVNLALGMAELSGRAEGVERAFQRAFPNAEVLLSSLVRATHGTVTELDLMQQTLKAQNLGIPIEEMATFLEFATIRAQQTGDSVDYLVDSIVNGLGRKSTRVIDNLGISATRLKDQFHGVSLEQLSVAEVATGVSEIIRQEMDKMGGYVETQQTQVKRLSVSWEELKTTLAGLNFGHVIEFFTGLDTGEFTLTGHLKDLVDGLKDVAEIVQRNISAEDLYRERQAKAIALASEREFANRVLKGTQEENIQAVKDEIAAITHQLGLAAKQRDASQQTIDKLKSMIEVSASGLEMLGGNNKAIKENIALQEKSAEQNKENIAIDQEVLKLLKARLDAMTKVNEEEVESTGIIERKKEEIEKLQKALLKTNDMADLEAGGRLTKALEIAQAELGDLQRAFKEFHIKEFKLEIKDATESILGFTDASNGIDSSIKENLLKRMEEGIANLANAKVNLPKGIIPMDFWDQLGKEWEDNWPDIMAAGIDIQTDLLVGLEMAEAESLKVRLKQTKEFYDDQIGIAGNNERAKEILRQREEKQTRELERRIFEREKQARRNAAIIDGAGAVVKAFVTAPNFAIAAIQAALIVATTLKQIAIINKTRPGFAKGVINLNGPGTTTSDSIPANLSRGESVIPAEQTQRSLGLLTAIKNKKIDDSILKALHLTKDGVRPSDAMTDERIVAELRKQKFPDYMHHMNMMWEVRKSADGLHKSIRLKSMG